ncbi:zinc ribbon domain-containing protein [Paraburkholderia bengalensis]|uniref:Zinc ribbon domain-containing protein n=1 Tax=Paraburkholderia bengalensis TaxID=2747562 RepID=A0ABU8ITJ0_9BURK
MSIWERVFGNHQGSHRGNGARHAQRASSHRDGREANADWGRSRASDWSAPSGKICSRCYAPASAHAQFCNRCGTSLLLSACGKCSGPLQAGARFCGQCGTAVP